MELNNGLYTVESTEVNGDVFDALIRLNPSHFIYAAHFPGEPITPGVCILQAALELLELYLGTALSVGRVKNVKFLKVITPDRTPLVHFRFRSVMESEGSISAQCTVDSENDVYAKISLICRRRTGRN